MAEFSDQVLAQVSAMGARAGEAWVNLGVPPRNRFTGLAGLEPLAKAWRDGYFAAAKQARTERAAARQARQARFR